MARVSDGEVTKVVASDWCHGTMKNLAMDLQDCRRLLHDIWERMVDTYNEMPDANNRIKFTGSEMDEIAKVTGEKLWEKSH